MTLYQFTLHFCLDYKDFYCNDVDDNNPTKVTITRATIKTTKTKATLFLPEGSLALSISSATMLMSLIHISCPLCTTTTQTITPTTN
jgi:hypothetical protein